MRSDGAKDVKIWTEWDLRLEAMAEIGRAYMHGGLKEQLALLGLLFLQRRNRLSLPDTTCDALNIALTLARAIEEHARVQGRPLSDHLLSGLRNIDPIVTDRWLAIASENWPIEGFVEWFAAMLDELPFTHHHDTPASLSRLVASLLSGQSPNAILDPACGTGGILAAMADEFEQATLFGREINSEAWAWSELRFLVRDQRNNTNLSFGNAFVDEPFPRLAPKEGFDIIVTNPPFGMRIDSHTVGLLSRRPNSRIPESSGRLSSETAYIQEVITCLSDSGIAAVIVPNGFLSRGGVDQKLRETLIQDDIVQTVVGLPERVFAPGTTIETAILFLSRQKLDNQKGRVLFLDARRLGQREGVRTVLDDESAEQIESGYTNWRDKDGFSRVVSFKDIDPTSFSLSPTRYIKPATRLAMISPHDRRSRIDDLDARYAALCREYDALRSKLTQPS